MPPGYGTFEFDILPPLVDQLSAFIDEVEAAPLTAQSLEEVEDAQGVYVLFYNGNRVYVGKTDKGAGLLSRLDRHRKNIAHRHNLSGDNVRFKAIRVAVFTAMDLEFELIHLYGDELAWNGSGFGNNDPGARRDKTREAEGNFDYDFPLDLSRPVGPFSTGRRSVSELLAEARKFVPYTIRFATGTGKRPHEDLLNTHVAVDQPTMSMARLIELIIVALPSGWQVTRLHGRIIGYKSIEEYEWCVQWWRSPGSSEPLIHRCREIP